MFDFILREMEAMQWQGGRPMMPLQGCYPRPLMAMAPVRRPDSADDRHVMAKHANIYPNETEVSSIYHVKFHLISQELTLGLTRYVIRFIK